MKSTLFKNNDWLETDRHIIECSCLNSKHLMEIDVDHRDKHISFSFVSDWRLSFSDRVKEAFNYIFFNKWYNTSNTVMITRDNIEDLEKAIEDIKRVI